MRIARQEMSANARDKEPHSMHYDGPISLKEMKRNAAAAALDFIEPGTVIGVGSGTTVWCFIDLLAERRVSVSAAVAASLESARRLREIGVDVVDLADARPALYVDGADEVDMCGRAIKGGGAAHRHEKMLAMACDYWACIVDAGKIAQRLGGPPIPLEVAAGRSADVIAAIGAMGGHAALRPETLTDDGNPVVDVTGLPIVDPLALEIALDAIPGVVANGIFAKRRADVILVGRAHGGVSRIVPKTLDEL